MSEKLETRGEQLKHIFRDVYVYDIASAIRGPDDPMAPDVLKEVFTLRIRALVGCSMDYSGLRKEPELTLDQVTGVIGALRPDSRSGINHYIRHIEYGLLGLQAMGLLDDDEHYFLLGLLGSMCVKRDINWFEENMRFFADANGLDASSVKAIVEEKAVTLAASKSKELGRRMGSHAIMLELDGRTGTVATVKSMDFPRILGPGGEEISKGIMMELEMAEKFLKRSGK